MAKVNRPAAFVRAPVADERLFELWPQIERAQMRRTSRRRLARRAAAGAAGLGALIAALVLAQSPDAELVATHPTTVEEEKGDAPRQLSLADGSQLSLSADARAHVVAMRKDEVRVRLDQGRVECEVAPDRDRRFIVETGPFEVVVTGTRFTVAAGADADLPASVVVRVERGSVQVRQPPDRLLATLEAGQLWASERDRNAVPVPLELPDAGSLSTAAPQSDVSSSKASSKEMSPKGMSAKATVSRAAPPAPARATPDVLLARASDARVAGKASEAAAALDELIRRYPRDERAGYAAFMLGRVRLDSLGDPKAAAEAFSFAVAHPGSGFFPEDAEARLVEALSKAGQKAECEQARARFLAKYPRAARAAAIERECLGK